MKKVICTRITVSGWTLILSLEGNLKKCCALPVTDCITYLRHFQWRGDFCLFVLLFYFLMPNSHLAAAPYKHPQNCFAAFLHGSPAPSSPLVQIPITYFSVWLPKSKRFFFQWTISCQENTDTASPFGQALPSSPLPPCWEVLSVRISNVVLSTHVKPASVSHLALAGGKCLWNEPSVTLRHSASS